MNNKISVIVPVFNTVGVLLDRAVNSLLNQTIGDVEILLVDDGSESQETLKSLEFWEKKGIRTIHLKNGGQGTARNIAFEYTNGDFIGYLDSDDWLDDNFYEVLYQRCIDDGSDIACGALVLEYPNRREIMDNPNEGVETKLIGKIKRVNNGSCCTKIFKRELIAQAKFPEGYYYEDNTMLAEMLILSNKVSYTSKVCYHYYQHETSTVHSPMKAHKRESDGIAIMAYIKGLADKLPSDERKAVTDKFYEILLHKAQYFSDNFYRTAIDAIFTEPVKLKLSFAEQLFSIVTCHDRRYKQLTILGLHFKFRNKKYWEK